jgi:hypothetical protein
MVDRFRSFRVEGLFIGISPQKAYNFQKMKNSFCLPRNRGEVIFFLQIAGELQIRSEALDTGFCPGWRLVMNFELRWIGLMSLSSIMTLAFGSHTALCRCGSTGLLKPVITSTIMDIHLRKMNFGDR